MVESIKNNQARLVLNLAIDVSGSPSSDVYVGLASFAIDKINRLEKSFKKEFPRIYYGKHKGSKLKPNELIKAIKFLNVKNCAHKIHPQNLVVCKENYLDINKTWIYFQYLAKSNNFTIISTYGHSNSNFLIKIADLVASVHRKVDKKDLKNFNRYFIYQIKDLDHKFIKRIFEK